MEHHVASNPLLPVAAPRSPANGTATRKHHEAEQEQRDHELLISARVWQRRRGSGLLRRWLWGRGLWRWLWGRGGVKACFGCERLVRVDDQQREEGRRLAAWIPFLHRCARRQRAHIANLNRLGPVERVVVLKRAGADINCFGARVGSAPGRRQDHVSACGARFDHERCCDSAVTTV